MFAGTFALRKLAVVRRIANDGGTIGTGLNIQRTRPHIGLDDHIELLRFFQRRSLGTVLKVAVGRHATDVGSVGTRPNIGRTEYGVLLGLTFFTRHEGARRQVGVGGIAGAFVGRAEGVWVDLAVEVAKAVDEAAVAVLGGGRGRGVILKMTMAEGVMVRGGRGRGVAEDQEDGGGSGSAK